MMTKKMKKTCGESHLKNHNDFTENEPFDFTFRCRVGHPRESIAVANDGGTSPQVLGIDMVWLMLKMKLLDFMEYYSYI